MDKDLWDASSDGKLENVKKELARGADVNWTATDYSPFNKKKCIENVSTDECTCGDPLWHWVWWEKGSGYRL